MSRPGAFSEGIGPGLVYLGYRAAAKTAELLPNRAGNAAARIGGAVAHRLSGKKRAIVRRNLARVVGEGPHLDRAVKEAFHSYARYWLETFRSSKYRASDLLDMVTCESIDTLEAVYREGRGVVVVSGHFGFYDLGAAWVGVKGFPMTTAAEVLRPRALFEWFAESRRERGMAVIPARPAAEARRKLAEVVQSGEGVALVSDRDLGRRGVWVKLFGEATTIPAFPSLLVARTGAALVSGAIYSWGHGYRMDFERVGYALTGNEAQDVEVIAQLIAGAIEEMVRKAPEQWHLFSTNWPSDEPHLPPRGGREPS